MPETERISEVFLTSSVVFGSGAMGGSPGTGRISEVFLTSSVVFGSGAMSPAVLGTMPVVWGVQLVAARIDDTNPVSGMPFLMRFAMVDSFFLFSLVCGFMGNRLERKVLINLGRALETLEVPSYFSSNTRTW